MEPPDDSDGAAGVALRLIKPSADGLSEAESSLEDRWLAEHVQRAKQTLTRPQLVAFELCCIKEVPRKEAARLMGCSRKQVRQLVYKAQARLRQALEGLREELDGTRG